MKTKKNKAVNNDAQILRLKELVELTKLSRSTLLKLVDDHLFPSPIKLSVKAVGWRYSDVLEWINGRPTAE